MSNLYNLTQQLHQTIKEKAEKHGLELVIESDYIWFYQNLKSKTGEDLSGYYCECFNANDTDHPGDFISAIQAPQIRQILLAFKEVLGENPILTENRNLYEKYGSKFNFVEFSVFKEITNYIVEFQAEAIGQKWLDGLEPMIDRELEQVLTELLEILKTL